MLREGQLNKHSKYLVTGGSGYLGKALIKRMTEEGFTNIVVLSRDEENLVILKDKFPAVKIIVGDVNNQCTCDRACEGAEGIFHLAAFKHVGLAEENTTECILSNVVGSLNILNSTIKYKPKFIIGISTDKASNPKGVYGMTKLLMERMFSEFESNKDTQYRIVRYGNVLYSTGSVLCKWRDRIKEGEQLIVTDLESTRFYWTVDEAVDLIFNCLENAKDARPFNTSMRSIRLKELVEAMIEKYADKEKMPITGYPIKLIGLQQGENMHEKITEDGNDSGKAERYTKEEVMNLI